MTGNITLIARTAPTTRETTATLRSVTQDDAGALARLLLEAYGTENGGSQERAEAMIHEAFDGKYGPFLAEQSQLAQDADGHPVAAAIVLERREDTGLPDVPAWLRSLRLHKYTPNFEGCKWQDMVVMDEAALEKQGVAALGARRKMLKTFEVVRKKMGIPDPEGMVSAASAPTSAA